MLEVRRGVPLFLILAGASCNTATDTTTEGVAADLTNNATYYLKLPKMSGDTGNAITISGSSLADKAFAVEWDYNGSKAEQFKAVPSTTAANYYQLQNANSGKCLNVYLGAVDSTHPTTGNVDGTLVQQYTCGSGDNNYWQFISYNGYYKIVSKLHTGDGKYRCLDIRGGDTHTANGSSVEIWTCGSSTSTKGNQTFNPVIVGSSGTGGSGGSGGSGGTGGTSGSGGTGGSTTDPCLSTSLTWHSANKTYYTSYPAPGSEECIVYSGCQYEGQFQACSGTMSQTWVSQHNIAAMFPLTQFGINETKRDICIKSGSKHMVVTVIDTCGDSDCGGCCTENRGSADALIDLESYTNSRFGVSDGPIQWADIRANPGICN